MLETRDLILDKAKYADWQAMYYNVWRHPACARYMMWSVTESEADARSRIKRTIAFQETHDAYFVYEKASGQAIGFAGIEQMEPGVCSETGICLGIDYQRKGYGRQIVQCLMRYSRERFHAREFLYSAREENAASIALARSMGFVLRGVEQKTDERDGQIYRLLRYGLLL